jgi:chromosome segregation ATPase
MLKKLVILAVVGFVGVVVVKGSKIGSYIRSEIASLRDQAEASIPPEKEIARLRNEIKGLDKDLMAVVNQLAKERVEVTQLKEKADDLRAKQSRDKELLLARGAAIDKATEQVTFGDRTLTVAAAKAELEEGMKRYTANENALKSMDVAIGSHEKVKDGLEKQLEALKTQKTELTAAIDALEAELTMLKLQQMESKYQTDDTRLGKIKEDVQALRKKMAIEREKLKLLPNAFDAPTTPTTTTKTGAEITAPLLSGDKPAKPAATTKTEPKMPIVE